MKPSLVFLIHLALFLHFHSLQVVISCQSCVLRTPNDNAPVFLPLLRLCFCTSNIDAQSHPFSFYRLKVPASSCTAKHSLADSAFSMFQSFFPCCGGYLAFVKLTAMPCHLFLRCMLAQHIPSCHNPILLKNSATPYQNTSAQYTR